MGSLWQDIFINVIAAFIFIFLLLLFFKPKVGISPNICFGKLHLESEESFYFIKMINYSLFSAYEVKFELIQLVRYTAENSHLNERATPLNLVVDSVSHIPGFRPSWLRRNAPYAVRIRTTVNLSEILRNDFKSVILKVSLKHGLTGLVRVKTKLYSDESQIKHGRFKYGLSFGILY